MNYKLKLALAKSKREQEEKLRFITHLNDVIDNNIDKYASTINFCKLKWQWDAHHFTINSSKLPVWE